MMIDKRDIYNCIFAAEKNIYEARTHLETGSEVLTTERKDAFGLCARIRQ